MGLAPLHGSGSQAAAGDPSGVRPRRSRAEAQNGRTIHKRNRLIAKDDFDRVMQAGQRVTRPEFVLYHRFREAPEVPRIGFAVGRRIGGAVVRNRARRLLREGVRALVPRLVPCDVVIVARPPIIRSGARDLEAALADATARAGLLGDPISAPGSAAECERK